MLLIAIKACISKIIHNSSSLLTHFLFILNLERESITASLHPYSKLKHLPGIKLRMWKQNILFLLKLVVTLTDAHPEIRATQTSSDFKRGE